MPVRSKKREEAEGRPGESEGYALQSKVASGEHRAMHSRARKLAAFGRLLDIMDELREKCPWNAEQTPESIRRLTEEEVYELSDAILKGDAAAECKEIGDLLYHMVFYARMGQERGEFDIADSINNVCDKMVFRHPHVFGPQAGTQTTAKEIADTWELVKAKEKGGNRTVMAGIPDAMPALLKALAMQEKARGCGFDWEKREDVWDKVLEELREVREVIAEPSVIPGESSVIPGEPSVISSEHGESRNLPAATEEFGDLLFAVLNAARLYGVDAEAALNGACSKFRRRFDYIEEHTLKRGLKFSDRTLAQLDALWDEAKSLGL